MGRKETHHPRGRKKNFTVGARLEFVLFSLFLQIGLLQPLKSNPDNTSPKQTQGKNKNIPPNNQIYH
jgi:hypothetical protein